MVKENTAYCYACNQSTELEAEQKILRHEECPHCQIQLHCCKMCVFYDTKVYNECREPLAERLVDKEKANFCSYFKIGNGKTMVQQKRIYSLLQMHCLKRTNND